MKVEAVWWSERYWAEGRRETSSRGKQIILRALDKARPELHFPTTYWGWSEPCVQLANFLLPSGFAPGEKNHCNFRCLQNSSDCDDFLSWMIYILLAALWWDVHFFPSPSLYLTVKNTHAHVSASLYTNYHSFSVSCHIFHTEQITVASSSALQHKLSDNNQTPPYPRRSWELEKERWGLGGWFIISGILRGETVAAPQSILCPVLGKKKKI